MKRLIASLFLISSFAHAADPLSIDVYRDPNCGCCEAWIVHLEENGFAVTDHLETDMVGVKIGLGVTPELASCHTAVIGDQFIEGHVPAADILAARNRPDVLGLAVPGMPIGSPGMEMGSRRDPFDVIAVDAKGEAAVFNSYPGNLEQELQVTGHQH